MKKSLLLLSLILVASTFAQSAVVSTVQSVDTLPSLGAACAKMTAART